MVPAVLWENGKKGRLKANIKWNESLITDLNYQKRSNMPRLRVWDGKGAKKAQSCVLWCNERNLCTLIHLIELAQLHQPTVVSVAQPQQAQTLSLQDFSSNFPFLPSLSQHLWCMGIKGRLRELDGTSSWLLLWPGILFICIQALYSFLYTPVKTLPKSLDPSIKF